MDRFEAFTGSVLELNRCLQKLKEVEMRSFGLRANHVMVLYNLGKNPAGLTATELTAACREDKAAVSRCLAQLLERGYVAGDFPEGKRSYRTRLYLTESGRHVAAAMTTRVAAAVSGGSDGLTEEQRDTFYMVMDRIIGNLCAYLAEKNAAVPAGEPDQAVC